MNYTLALTDAKTISKLKNFQKQNTYFFISVINQLDAHNVLETCGGMK